MYNDTEAFGWHHVVLKINNRSCRPGVDHLGRQLTIKQGTTTSSASYLRKLDWATSTICKYVNCCTNAINESFDKYRPLRFPTLLHLTVGYHYTLEYRTPLCSTSSNRKASSRSGPHRDPSALTPYLWVNTELCTQPLTYSQCFKRILLVKKKFKFHAPVQKCHFGKIEKLPKKPSQELNFFVVLGSYEPLKGLEC